MGRKIVVGSRDSKLAVAQSELVISIIRKHHPELDIELLTMKTTGDIILDKRLDKIGGKGLFVKELDLALEQGKTDISVHSLKDMPMEVPEELPLLCFSKRENPFDVLVFPNASKNGNMELPLGTSSMRRELQLRELFPEWEVESIRGNLQTRLNKLDDGKYGAIVLAHAGLSRLGMTGRIGRVFTAEEMIPSAGQGILAIQGRKGENYDFLDCVFDEIAGLCARIERMFTKYLDGGCSSPIAAYAEVHGTEMILRGLYCNEETCEWTKGAITGDTGKWEHMAESLAKDLKGKVG